ncbi:MAG: hypothetical protein KDD58_00225 [Bdellovibrionales bacterium]|nr:hypothetical protein [Bdellovibrionales bacterium]
MKIFKILGVLSTLLWTSQIFANVDFVEAQLSIARNSSGDQLREIIYFPDTKIYKVEYQVEWINYDPQWHQTGFWLGRSYTAYVDFPDLYDCRLEGFGGVLHSPSDLQGIRNVTLYFGGEGCVDSLKLLDKVLPTLSFYGVPFLEPIKESTNVLKIIFW